jgi:antitoxin component YwqK of YwqJK toxin-antitoxin module
MRLTITGLLLFVLLGMACTTETITTTDEFGRTIRFTQRKSDQKKEGKYERFHENGQLLESAVYVNDSLHGERKFFYPNGTLESVELYQHGVQNGEYIKYRENGTLAIKQMYLNGLLNGKSIKYYPNGQVEEEVTMQGGGENGPFHEFYESGVVKAEGSYLYLDEEALEHGELREYDSTGTLIRTADCVQGLCRTRK